MTVEVDPSPTNATSVPSKVWTVISPMTQNAAGTFTQANDAYLFRVEDRAGSVTVSKVYLRVNIANGNIDVGIYSLSGTTLTREGSSGSVACPTAGEATVNLTAPVTLDPTKVYFIAIAADGIVASFMSGTGSANHQAAPINGAPAYRKASASVPLPASFDTSATVAPDKYFIVAAK